MAFKMSYSFEGNSKSRPEQNLSGSSKKLSKESLLQKTHEERRKRQEQRLKLQSTQILQSHIRSWIVRKHKKDEERQLFTQLENTASNRVLLSKLLFFYDAKTDKDKLFRLASVICNCHTELLGYINGDASFSWLIKRYLVLCLKTLNEHEDNAVLMKSLYIFTTNACTFEYLIRKGYYTFLRKQLDTEHQCLEEIIILIQKPFRYLGESDALNDLCLSGFTSNFLNSTLSHNVKNVLIPHLKNNSKDLPFDQLLKHLNSGFHFDKSPSLFYSILALEPDDYEPNCDSVQVLSKLSRNIHQLRPSSDLTKEDSDDEEEEEELVTEQRLLLSDYLLNLNRYGRVKKLLTFFEQHCNDEEVPMAFTVLCHNLLLVYKDSMKKYLCNKNSDTSETFSKKDLYSMSVLLKNVARELIKITFPMSRSCAVQSTPEVVHLYKACFNSVRVLYMLDLRKQFCPAGFWTSEKIHIPADLSRKNYFSSTLHSFHGSTDGREDEEQLPPLSTIEQRSLAILEELPFLINFNTRVLFLRDLCRNSLGPYDYYRHHSELLHDNVIVIRRTHIYEDAFEKISNKSELDLKHKVRIQFINSVGLEEAGIDGGGIFKEFINEVLKTAFDPNRGFFLLTADNTLYPNPNVHLIVNNFTDHYYFIGRLVGKAIFENILVDLPLAEFFLAKLLVDRAPAHYLKSLDPVLYRNLLYMRDFNGDITDLGLDFTTVNNDLGETRIMELKPNGADIPVTNENRLEYIQRLADLKLNRQLKKQCTAFRNGLNSVVPLPWLKLFSHKELQVIIGGDTQEIDLSDLFAHTVYGGEFGPDHPTIVLFWKILHKFTAVQKKQLLKFVTSCSRPPLLGFKELTPLFCIQSSGSENRMPSASTCLNLLKIPVITDEETLRYKLTSAIEQQAGFELS
nr:ubiquitin-protein ligase E3C [Leptinotarsa decemlineata]